MLMSATGSWQRSSPAVTVRELWIGYLLKLSRTSFIVSRHHELGTPSSGHWPLHYGKIIGIRWTLILVAKISTFLDILGLSDQVGRVLTYISILFENGFWSHQHSHQEILEKANLENMREVFAWFSIVQQSLCSVPCRPDDQHMLI